MFEGEAGELGTVMGRSVSVTRGSVQPHSSIACGGVRGDIQINRDLKNNQVLVVSEMGRFLVSDLNSKIVVVVVVVVVVVGLLLTQRESWFADR